MLQICDLQLELSNPLFELLKALSFCQKVLLYLISEGIKLRSEVCCNIIKWDLYCLSLKVVIS